MLSCFEIIFTTLTIMKIKNGDTPSAEAIKFWLKLLNALYIGKTANSALGTNSKIFQIVSTRILTASMH